MQIKNIGNETQYYGCFDWKNVVEKKYVKDIIEKFRKKGVKQKVIVLSFKSNQKDRKIKDYGIVKKIYKKENGLVTIYLSDEGAEIPSKICKYSDVVFKAHLPDGSKPKNLFHFPIGVANYEKVGSEFTNIKKDINVFFCGNLNNNRIELHRLLNESIIPLRIYRKYIDWFDGVQMEFSDSFPESIIKFTDQWAGGMSPEKYHETLRRSKIALCPAGFRRTETLRHFEALQAGCVIISNQLPSDNPFYNTEAIIQVDSYDEMISMTENLLRDETRLKELTQKSQRWWEKMCSPEAVADYMISKLDCHE